MPFREWAALEYNHSCLLARLYAVSERTKYNNYYEIAMMDGTLMIQNGDAFLGPSGSGKTHTLAALLGEDPPSTRESTPCAKNPIRSISHCKVGVNWVHFIYVCITNDEYSAQVPDNCRLNSLSNVWHNYQVIDFTSHTIISATECNSFVGSETQWNSW